MKKFIRQNLLLLVALYIMAFGCAMFLCSHLGSSAISSLPFVLSLAGNDHASQIGIYPPALTVGGYTIVMNAIFVVLQILLLRRRFQPFQLLQLVVGAFFSVLIDVNMGLINSLITTDPSTTAGLINGIILVVLGGAVMGLGVACEVRCKSAMMPGEGIQIAIATVTGKEFSRVKIITDTSLVALAVVCCFLFYGHWRFDIVGIGTLISMIYVGAMVSVFNRHLSWWDKLLGFYEQEKATTNTALPQEEYPLVITISRFYGSGASEISKKLSQQLGMKVYDHELIDATAQKINMQPTEVAGLEQNISTPKLVELTIANANIAPLNELSPADRLFLAQSQIIQQFAAQESCIIVGRCADYILRNRPNTIRIFLRTDPEIAAQRIAHKDHVSQSAALTKITTTNRARANHFLHFTGQTWGDPKNYDLVVNTSSIGLDKVAQIIINLVK